MKTGILLTNLGTPDAPTKPALKRYLKQFLSDSRVIQPRSKFLWWLILNVVILNTRPAKSAQAYAKVWNIFGKGSPLLNITLMQAKGIEKILSNNNIELEVGMRYGCPCINSALTKLRGRGCEKIVVLPLYPQHSDSTTTSTMDVINETFKGWDSSPELEFIDNYYANEDYIQSLANSVIEHQKLHGKPEKLMMSFHGIPKRFVDNGDVYYEHCLETSVLLAKKLELQDGDYQLCFQSIFGPEEWIKPETKGSLESLAKEGVRHVQVICPGFSSDCLETLEEIDEENREYFIQAGGKQFSYIPALNDRNDHLEALSNIIIQRL